jgi:hypothetical protein
LQTGLPETTVDKLVFALQLAEQLKVRLITLWLQKLITLLIRKKHQCRFGASRLNLIGKSKRYTCPLEQREAHLDLSSLKFRFQMPRFQTLITPLYLPRLFRVLEFQSSGKMFKLRKMRRFHHPNCIIFTISDCSVAKYNQAYSKTSELHHNKCVCSPSPASSHCVSSEVGV